MKMAIEICSNCKDEIGEWQILNYGLNPSYYCDEKCLREDNPELSHLSMEEMYEQDIQYYTTWFDEED